MLRTILHEAKRLLLRASTALNESRKSVLGTFCDHVDHAGDGVGSPDRATGPADHFDSVDVF